MRAFGSFQRQYTGSNLNLRKLANIAQIWHSIQTCEMVRVWCPTLSILTKEQSTPIWKQYGNSNFLDEIRNCFWNTCSLCFLHRTPWCTQDCRTHGKSFPNRVQAGIGAMICGTSRSEWLQYYIKYERAATSGFLYTFMTKMKFQSHGVLSYPFSL